MSSACPSKPPVTLREWRASTALDEIGLSTAPFRHVNLRGVDFLLVDTAFLLDSSQAVACTMCAEARWLLANKSKPFLNGESRPVVFQVSQY
jgi:hypothetical protein